MRESLRILFYQKSGKGAVISSGVHITEVLARLSRIGYSIIFVDGDHYSNTALEKTDIISPISYPESLWGREKDFFVRETRFVENLGHIGANTNLS